MIDKMIKNNPRKRSFQIIDTNEGWVEFINNSNTITPSNTDKQSIQIPGVPIDAEKVDNDDSLHNPAPSTSILLNDNENEQAPKAKKRKLNRLKPKVKSYGNTNSPRLPTAITIDAISNQVTTTSTTTDQHNQNMKHPKQELPLVYNQLLPKHEALQNERINQLQPNDAVKNDYIKCSKTINVHYIEKVESPSAQK